MIRLVLAASVLSQLVACSTTSTAPVFDRNSGNNKPIRPSTTSYPSSTNTTGATTNTSYTPPASPRVLPLDRPGYYVVKSGDTLYGIARALGTNYRDIATLNNLENINVIYEGQELKVPSTSSTGTPSTGQVPRPPVRVDPNSVVRPPRTEPIKTPPVIVEPVIVKPSQGIQPVVAPMAWPAAGKVIHTFKEGANKGIDIEGKAGDAVNAADDGKVVYAGNGLRGYGNMVILKHNGNLLTAYAHNQKILVKEGQTVTRGQRIAEMGSTESETVKLHFEVRNNGKPIDPSTVLPKR